MHTLEPRQTSSVPEVLARHEVKLHHHLSVHGVAGVSGTNTAVTVVSRMIHSLNILGGGLWSRVIDDNVQNLLELRIHASILVRISKLVCMPLHFHT